MPRITILRIMIIIAVIGVGLGMLRVHLLASVATFYFAALFGLARSSVFTGSYPGSWAFVPAAIGLDVSLLVEFAEMPLFHKSYFFMASIFSIPFVAGLALTWITSLSERPARMRAAWIVAASLGFAASMLATGWPLRLAFYVSSPALNRLADRFEAGEVLTSPEWAGVFRVHRVGSYNDQGDTMLRINPARGLRAGFVRSKGAAKGARREALDYQSEWAERWNYFDSW